MKCQLYLESITEKIEYGIKDALLDNKSSSEQDELSENNIYSIHYKPKKIDEDSKKENLKKTSIDKKIIRYEKDKIGPLKKYFFPSLKGDILYIIAIIDFFQQYNLNKVLETKFKLLKSGVKERDISSVPPEKYKDRFIEFIESITDIENYVKGLADPESKNDFE